MFRILIFTAAVISCMASCRSTKNIQTAIAKKDTATAIIPVDNGHEDSLNFIKEVYGNLKNQRIDFTTFSAKVKVDYTGADNKKYDVNAILRMYKDSVIWMSVNAIFGIEALRVYITKDSVKLLDKQNKLYTARSVAYLQEVTELPLDLPTLQELIIGNPVFLDSNIASYSVSANSISLLSFGVLFKNLVTVTENEKFIQHSKLDDLDGTPNRTCDLSYSGYENKKGKNFSISRIITISEKSKLDVRLDFKQYDFNELLSFPFSVPKNYKRN